MQRRNVLMSVAAGAAGVGLAVAGSGAARARAPGTAAGAPPAGAVGLPFIAAADGTQLFYRDWGRGTPVVFIHSWAMNADMWHYQTAAFAGGGLRCVTYDRRGHGRSSQPGHGYDYDTLADDLATVMTRLDLREATLVGHSTGSGNCGKSSGVVDPMGS
jgi:non-heme chloroperoxidase